MLLTNYLAWTALWTAFASGAIPVWKRQNTTSSAPVVRINQTQYAVVAPDYMRNLSVPFPPDAAAPAVQVWDDRFYEVLGDSPDIVVIATGPDEAYAHEAAVWDPNTNSVFWASNANAEVGPTVGNYLNELSLAAYFATGNSNATTIINSTSILNNTNGGTNYGSELLYVTQGQNQAGGALTLINPQSPYNTTVILNSFYGRQFNALNDVDIHPVSKDIFFTDTIYVRSSYNVMKDYVLYAASQGHAQGFRPNYTLPQQVYRFNRSTGAVEVVADGFTAPNGIAFNEAGDVAYVTDTGATLGTGSSDYSLPATIYAFDVLPISQGQRFANRRVLAYMTFGIPDGLKVDSLGNIYTGCDDGVSVYNPAGTLLGKFFVGHTVSNMVFAGQGNLVMLGEQTVYLAKLAVGGILPRQL